MTQSESLADKLNALFERAYPASQGRPYTNREAAAMIRAKGGQISDVYIWQLRKGLRTNPTKDHLESLADFFGVSPAYFFEQDVTDRTLSDLSTLETLRRLKPAQVSLRTVLEQEGLSAESRELIQQVIQRCLELEGLTDDGSRTSRPRERTDGGAQGSE